MHYDQIPEKPLVASPNIKVSRASPVFFFEKEDGSIIHVDEKTAYAITRGRNQEVGKFRERMKLIGTGTGEVFARYMQEAKQMFATAGLEASQEHIRKGVEAELEEARKTIIKPRNFDTQGIHGQIVDISKL